MKLFLSCLLLLTLLSGCNQRTPESIQGLPELEGKECHVVYRRDALGYATNNDGISAEIIQTGTKKLAVSGKLKRANGEWVVLETPQGLRTIPVSSVLGIFEKQ